MLDIQTATTTITSVTALAAAIQGFIVQLLTSIAAISATVISVSAVIAKYMPPPDQPGVLSKLHKIINSWGQNAGYASNAPKDGD